MDQDKEFLHWIMQSNPLDDPDAAYGLSHPQQQQQQSQSKVPQATLHHPAPPNVYTQAPYPNVQQPMYDERFYHKSCGNETGPVNQGPQQPQAPYTSHGMMAPGPPAHYYHPPPHNHSYNQQQQHNVKPVNSGRLSDDDEEHYTDAQLKMMTSKERRQLRNKISARNFRNRRKEYIASLEGEVAKYKNENSQLRLEIKWVRTTMNKLQKENDHLRVKLALCHGGIKTDQQESTTTTSSDQLSPPTVSAASSSLSPPPTIQQEQSYPVLPISNANVSQKSTSSASSLNLQTQNGNSPHDLHVTSRHLYNTSSPPPKSQHIYHPPENQPISPPSTGNQWKHQQTASSPGTGNQHQQPLFNTSPSQAIPGSTDTIHSDSSSSFASHLSPPNYADLADAWDLVIPNEFSSYCPPSTNMTQPSDNSLFYTNMPFEGQHPSYHGNALVPVNMSMVQQQQPMNYTPNQATPYRPPTDNQNNSYVSSAVVPDFDFANILGKRQPGGGLDNNLFKNYPLLVPALMSIVIGHTMSMSTEDLLSHTRLLSTPTPNRPRDIRPFGTSKRMIPGLKSFQQPYPLSKKQVHAMWENLLDQMVLTKSKQRRRQKLTTVVTDKPEQSHEKEDIETQVVKEMVQSTMKWTDEHDNDDYYDDDYDDDEPWYDMPVTGFKAICPLYWMQRQFCKFVITYVVVKYPHLEDPCKTYLPICEQFRRRAISN